ncbi:doublesex- and mab-3-related transcription factor B1-like [Anarrhichthys ocellatus]|uniref:doublesex- and mab-3-related transcription factor B1-like n=1 Tax=Anarrhichthys ocellatus TaxID=433405 RepID=UPI0012EE1A9A|nr:doublesex- and mab-3-related transcription factor B1-like [Anarrhichthys ocellatus]
MSLSKEQLSVAAAEQSRKPKCTRCRHHGIIVPQKGHVKCCPFLKCDCWKCYIITQRTHITALQRSLKKVSKNPQNKEQRLGVHTAVSAGKPAAEETCSPLAPDEEGLSAALGTERAAANRSKPAAGGQTSAGLDSGEVVPFTSSEEEPRTHAPYFGGFGPVAPLPVLHVPWMSGYPSGYGPRPNLLLHRPWWPPVPTGLYNNGLRGALMFPHFQPAAPHYPPPQGPGPAAEDCRPVFLTLRPLALPEPGGADVLAAPTVSSVQTH